jgi:hypothetical protein
MMPTGYIILPLVIRDSLKKLLVVIGFFCNIFVFHGEFVNSSVVLCVLGGVMML